MAFGVAPAQVNNSPGGPHYGLEMHAVEADPASAVRGSLGVSLENLGLSNDLGKLVFLLNGGFAHHREPIHEDDPFRDWRSGNSVTSI